MDNYHYINCFHLGGKNTKEFHRSIPTAMPSHTTSDIMDIETYAGGTAGCSLLHNINKPKGIFQINTYGYFNPSHT